MTLSYTEYDSSIPATMKAVVTTGNGGFDKLDYRDVEVPKIGAGEVLVKVLAAGVNNTEINTRLGWYSSKVKEDTEGLSGEQEKEASHLADGGWNDATPFPFIQGTDCCGEVVAVGANGDPMLVGKRVLVRPCMRPDGFENMDNVWMASDFDGAFAQYVKVPAGEVFPVEASWSDAELGSLPCAYGTSENMINRCKVKAGDHVLVPGGSGGVGSATIQLAKRRGAYVTAIVGKDKVDQVKALGADQVLCRGDNILEKLGKESVDVVVDNVGGENFPQMLEVLKRGGKYTSSGAIGGPIVELDLRTFYLKDITLVGCTAWDEEVFPNLVSYVERGEIRPLLADTFDLKDIATAQKKFMEKKHVGKFVLVPPQS